MSGVSDLIERRSSDSENEESSEDELDYEVRDKMQ